MKYKFSFILFFLLVISLANAQQKHFVLYHLVRYQNTPANLFPYLLPTKIASEHILLNANGSPDVAAIQAFAAQCPPGVLATLDLETWPYYPEEKLSKSVDYFLTALNAFKSVNTTSPVSFYGVPPKQVYQWKNIDPENNPNGYKNWKNINDELSPIAQKVGAFLPSFYMYNMDTVSWRKMVDTTIAAIKKYHQHKPIYAYIWPQFHNRSSYSLQFIDTATWKYQLRTLYDRIDGCIIWTSNKDSNKQIISWDPNMLWWQATKAFMVEKSLVPPLVIDSISIHRSRHKIKIRWTTSVDTLSSNFLVQHSTDGVHFEDVGNPVPTKHSFYTQNNYFFEDKISSLNKMYYRLEMTTERGMKKYSTVLILEPEEKNIIWGNTQN